MLILPGGLYSGNPAEWSIFDNPVGFSPCCNPAGWSVFGNLAGWSPFCYPAVFSNLLGLLFNDLGEAC